MLRIQVFFQKYKIFFHSDKILFFKLLYFIVIFNYFNIDSRQTIKTKRILKLFKLKVKKQYKFDSNKYCF